MFGDGPVPADRDLSVEDDQSGFLDVMRLLLRSWPFVRPQLLGRWWIPRIGVEPDVADNVAGSGYQFNYAPFLVAIIAFIGPWLGLLPASFDWQYLLYVPVAGMVLSTSLMAFSEGVLQRWGTIGLILSGIGSNVAATITDVAFYTDSIYAGTITLVCIVGWTFQYRITDGRFEYRIRTGTHLVYFYAINFSQRFINLAFSLVLVDLLNQNIFLGDPIAPGLADLLGLPSWAQGSIDELSREQRVDLLWIYLTLLATQFGIQFPLQIINPYYRMWIMQRINQDLRSALVQRWHQLSLSYHSDHRTGDSVYRIYQDSAMVTNVIDQLVQLTLVTGSYFTCVIFVSLLSPWLGLIAGSLIIPALLWAHWAMPRVRVRSLVYRAATSDVTSTIQETFGAIRLIKAFNNMEKAQGRMEQDSVIAFNAAYRVRALIAVVTIIMFTIAAMFMMSGEFLMAWWVNGQKETFAIELIQLIGVSFVVWNLASFTWTRNNFRESSGDLRNILRRWMTAQDIAMGLRRVFDILDLEPGVQDRSDAVPMKGFDHEIRFDHVGFAYEEDRPVLADVDFTATPGSVTAIIGPTGSGKSTLMALLLRLFDPATGSISIDGIDLRDYQVSTLRKNIAIALQENVLFAMSVRENIRYVSPDATEAQVTEAVRVAAMDEYVAGLPYGLDTVLSDRGGKLSSGQRQRLSIARAVVRDTAILILDEPTASLDAATEHRIMQNLAEWGTARGRAIFVITHRISTIRRADNILYLDAGMIVERGSHEELTARDGGRYKAFVDAESALQNTPMRT